MVGECKKVLIITGAGLSAASGVPTFRGDDGLWTKKYKDCEKPEDLATLKYFNKHPDQKWKWTHDFRQLCLSKEPNPSHYAIMRLQEYFKKSGVECQLVTQNIDDFHC